MTESEFITVDVEEPDQNSFLVHLMPWCDIGENIDFGSIKIWDLFRPPDNYVTSSNFVEFIPAIADCFRTCEGDPKESLFIVSDLSSDADGRNERIKWAAKALAFSYIAGLAESYALGKIDEPSFLSSERFSIQQVNIIEGMVDDSQIGVDKLVCLNKFRRFEPPGLLPTFTYPNRTILSALARLNDGYPFNQTKDADKELTKQRRKLWLKLETSLDWFVNGWSVGQNVNMQTRFISLMISFEALIRRDESDSRKIYQLASAAARICNWTGEVFPQKYTFQTTDKHGNCLTKNLTEPEMWIHEFAKIRNRLAHGQHVPLGRISFEARGDKVLSPLIAMVLIIDELVYANLRKLNLLEKCELEFLQARRLRIAEQLGWSSSCLRAKRPSESWKKIKVSRDWSYLFEDLLKEDAANEKVWSGTPDEFFDWLQNGKLS